MMNNFTSNKDKSLVKKLVWLFSCVVGNVLLKSDYSKFHGK